MAKPVFGILLLWGHRNIDPAVLGLHIRDYDDAIVGEKGHGGFGSSAAHHNTGAGHGVGHEGGVLGAGHTGHTAGTTTGADTGVSGAHPGGSTV